MEALDSGVLLADDWANNSADMYGSAYGELYGTMNDEMNSTIIEVAFHNNEEDAKFLKDPVARRLMSMSSYQGIVKHLATNNAAVPLALLPEPPTAVRAINSGAGRVTVSWAAPASGGAFGDPATGYVVYRSTNGYGFGNPVAVAGGGTTSLTFTNLAAGETWYFHVAATNRGGESLRSKVVGARVSPSGSAAHLVVDGFDRNHRTQTPNRYFANNVNGQVAMVRPRQINSFDYAVPHGKALAAAGVYFDTCGRRPCVVVELPCGLLDSRRRIHGQRNVQRGRTVVGFGVPERGAQPVRFGERAGVRPGRDGVRGGQGFSDQRAADGLFGRQFGRLHGQREERRHFRGPGDDGLRQRKRTNLQREFGGRPGGARFADFGTGAGLRNRRKRDVHCRAAIQQRLAGGGHGLPVRNHPFRKQPQRVDGPGRRVFRRRGAGCSGGAHHDGASAASGGNDFGANPGNEQRGRRGQFGLEQPARRGERDDCGEFAVEPFGAGAGRNELDIRFRQELPRHAGCDVDGPDGCGAGDDWRAAQQRVLGGLRDGDTGRVDVRFRGSLGGQRGDAACGFIFAQARCDGREHELCQHCPDLFGRRNANHLAVPGAICQSKSIWRKPVPRVFDGQPGQPDQLGGFRICRRRQLVRHGRPPEAVARGKRFRGGNCGRLDSDLAQFKHGGCG